MPFAVPTRFVRPIRHGLAVVGSWLTAALGPIVGRAADDVPTFATDVAPLLAQHCVACHHADGIGPFPLVTYRDAQRRARQIAEVVETRFMPPWKPCPADSPALQGDRTLDDATIATFVAWAAAGAPAGDLATVTPPALPTGGWALGPPDLEITFPEIFPLPAEGKDVFRNFVLPIPLAGRRFVRALEFRPGAARVIHHGTIAFDATGASRRRDAADPGPGFSAMELDTASNPNGHIIGWTPGQVPYEAYPGTAFALHPGTDLVLQLHLLPSGKPEPVAPRIGLYFTSEPPARTGFVALLRATRIDIPAGAADYAVEESLVLPAPVEVLGLYPHAHYLGHDLRLTAELPDGTSRGLLHIPDWDFNWQSDYRYVVPLPLPAGTRLVMHYTYDNSAANPRNPHAPPERVRYGWSSLDEMGEVALQLLLHDRDDLPKLEEAQSRYQLTSGDRTGLATYNLAHALDRQGRDEEAARVYREALRRDPQNGAALNNLAALQERHGDATGAATLYARALAADPTVSATRRNLAKLRQAAGQTAAAADLLRTGLDQHPEDLDLRLDLAALEMHQQHTAVAADILAAGLTAQGADPRLQLQLGQALLFAGDLGSGTAHLTRALALPVLIDGTVDPAATAQWQAEAAFSLALLAQQQRDLPGLNHHLQETLTRVPAHRDALLLSAGVALLEDDFAGAQPHLETLLRLPGATRPGENEVLRALPFPAGVHALARALAAVGRGDEARALLARRAAEARAHQRTDWAVAMEQTAATLAPSPHY